MRTILRQARPAIGTLFLATIVCGLIYPFAVLGVSQVAFRQKADGSLVRRNGVVIGSSLIGQTFTGMNYFQSRPSAAGTGYDATASSGSNLGPINEDFLKTVAERVKQYRERNGLAESQLVPVDAVTASGSGLDPHISVANARLQAGRISRTRGIPVGAVLQTIEDATMTRPLGFLGDEGVEVLAANLALDRASTTGGLGG